MSHYLSLHAAATLLACSKRTVWRRLGEGIFSRGPDDALGRATVSLEAVRAHSSLPMEAEGWVILFNADQGDRVAQCEMGLHLLQVHCHDGALYWLQLAAQQGEPDAMYWLGYCALKGWGGAPNPALGLQHISAAAAAGHSVALACVATLSTVPAEYGPA